MVHLLLLSVASAQTDGELGAPQAAWVSVGPCLVSARFAPRRAAPWLHLAKPHPSDRPEWLDHA